MNKWLIISLIFFGLLFLVYFFLAMPYIRTCCKECLYYSSGSSVGCENYADRFSDSCSTYFRQLSSIGSPMKTDKCRYYLGEDNDK